MSPHPPPPAPRAGTAGHDVVVIEARQAGPAAGYYLRAAGADFRILEAARTSGAALNAAGALITQAGRTPVPGLYTLGRPW